MGSRSAKRALARATDLERADQAVYWLENVAENRTPEFIVDIGEGPGSYVAREYIYKALEWFWVEIRAEALTRARDVRQHHARKCVEEANSLTDQDPPENSTK